MKKLRTPLVLSIALAAPAAAVADPLTLSLEGRTAALGEGGAEIAAYDERSERVFVTNALGEPTTPLPASSDLLVPTAGYEQRQFQLGFKFSF